MSPQMELRPSCLQTPVETLRRYVKRFRPQNETVILEEYPANWKNYYAILQLDVNDKPSAVKAAYKRLNRIFRSSLSEATRESRFYSRIIKETDEAYRVLSDPRRRLAYDNFYKARFSSPGVETDNEIADEIAWLSELTARDSFEKERQVQRILTTGNLRQAFLIVLASLAVLLTIGTSFALAAPGSAVARPFNGPAVLVLKTSSGTVALINDIRGVVARYERNIIQTSVQSMRVMENLSTVPTVSVPTSDMASFPSERNPLFPEYLDKRVSQFRYTCDQNGNVKVYSSTVATDEFLTKIEHLISELEEK